MNSRQITVGLAVLYMVLSGCTSKVYEAWEHLVSRNRAVEAAKKDLESAKAERARRLAAQDRIMDECDRLQALVSYDRVILEAESATSEKLILAKKLLDDPGYMKKNERERDEVCGQARNMVHVESRDEYFASYKEALKKAMAEAKEAERRYLALGGRLEDIDEGPFRLSIWVYLGVGFLTVLAVKFGWSKRMLRIQRREHEESAQRAEELARIRRLEKHEREALGDEETKRRRADIEAVFRGIGGSELTGDRDK